MNRKIAALALTATAVLLGACGSSEPDAAPSDAPIPQETTTTWAPADLELVDVTASKPAPGAPKVDPTTLPEEVAIFTAVPELTEPQLECITGSLKQSLDADPSLAKTPGKRASLGGSVLTVCDASDRFTNTLVEGGEAGPAALTPEQSACFKQAFATDKDQTAKVIAASLVSANAPAATAEAVKEALAPIEQKCGATLSDAINSAG